MASADYYSVLDVPRSASTDQIKESYKDILKECHPVIGRHGDEEKYKKAAKAFDVLRDVHKRELYDKYGEEGLKNLNADAASAGSGASSASASSGSGSRGISGTFDLFDVLSGRKTDMAQYEGGRRGNRSEHMTMLLPCTLEELYSGTTKTVDVNRTRICSVCWGKGTTNKEAVKSCDRCKGNGTVVQMAQVAPRFVTQMRATCPNCDGTGKMINKKNRCKKCSGKRVLDETTELVVCVDPGMKQGQKIVFPSEADQKPGTLPGDVIVIIEEKPHSLFERDSFNLSMTKKISLNDALTGVEFMINTLDNRTLLVKSKPGEIITPDLVRRICEEGMPVYKNTHKKGNLSIKFLIEFPDTLPDKTCSKLRTLLPPKRRLDPALKRAKNIEKCVLTDVTTFGEEEKEEPEWHRDEIYIPDEEDDQEGVACGTQ